MPRVHRVASLLKRWLLGTHQGAVSEKHLDYYLDEFTFRFNRRRFTDAWDCCFYRLLQNAVQVDPVAVPAARGREFEVRPQHVACGPSKWIPHLGILATLTET